MPTSEVIWVKPGAVDRPFGGSGTEPSSEFPPDSAVFREYIGSGLPAPIPKISDEKLEERSQNGFVTLPQLQPEPKPKSNPNHFGPPSPLWAPRRATEEPNITPELLQILQTLEHEDLTTLIRPVDPATSVYDAQNRVTHTELEEYAKTRLEQELEPDSSSFTTEFLELQKELRNPPPREQFQGDSQKVADYKLNPLTKEVLDTDNVAGSPAVGMTELYRAKKVPQRFRMHSSAKQVAAVKSKPESDVKLTSKLSARRSDCRREKIVYDQYDRPYMLCVEKSDQKGRCSMLAVSLSGTRYFGRCGALMPGRKDNDQFHHSLLGDALCYKNGNAKVMMQKVKDIS